MPAVKEYTTPNRPTWCPGCGNFGMWEALKRALSELELDFHEFSVVWGIGCHGNGADFLKTHGFHALHGRALPVAQAVKLARPDLKVIVEAGDGDGYGLGMGHFVHALRRNIDLTYIGHNNQIYGLTTGQASPTTDQHMKSPSTPKGVLEEPINPIGIALAEGATFVARGFAGDIPHLTELYKQAIQHRGFAIVDVFQPCVTFNRVNTFPWFRERVFKLEDRDWDTSDRAAAFELSMTTFHELLCEPDQCTVPTGVFYRREGVKTYEDGLAAYGEPLWKRALAPRDISDLLAEFT